MVTHDTLFSISLIQAEQTYPLRAAILLNGNLDACELPGDIEATTLHLAIRNPAGIVAVASLREERRDDDPAHAAWRLRGMAVQPEVRGMGFGRVLVQIAVRHAQTHGAELVWCTARESAYRFYEKLGFVPDASLMTMPGRTDTAFYVMRRRLERRQTQV
ncbi:GNAT family N-acetyltransferase [Burkholderia contaminans]|uniref:GNAT family N-acetyltransferase n=1 Tax=Burkholderia sp. D-99 TaxID=2717316 RepID=UPI001420D03D|nr:GNAT family N-acetyltransferase [Burkholderia sp. D-99]MBZ5796140.1 GNAT family N-acetyltransferase [Burkholderia contaminans]NHV25560.1 GNAT family N-acetyltransferase [Burkholderia sp. D-99]